MERIKGKKTVQVGQRVHCILYGGKDGIVYKIEGEQKPETIGNISGCVSFGGNAEFKIVFDDHFSTIYESMLHGVQWRIYDEIASQEGIDAAIKRTKSFIETAKQKKETKAEARAALKIKIKQDNPHLKTAEDFPGKSDLVIGAKNIRIELKLAFPGQKFSVTSDSYSMGSAIRVNWIDGPRRADVEAIINKYQEGHFNGMEDIYEYDRDNVWTDVFGGTKYVSESREYSKEANQKAVEEFKDYELNGYELDRKKWQWLADQDFYIKPEKSASVVANAIEPDQKTDPTNEIKIIHNEKLNGIEIYFPGIPDLKTRDILKSNDFRWHRVKGCWYITKSDKALETAQKIAGVDQKTNLEFKESKTVNLPDNVRFIKDFLPVESEIIFDGEMPKDIKILN